MPGEAELGRMIGGQAPPDTLQGCCEKERAKVPFPASPLEGLECQVKALQETVSNVAKATHTLATVFEQRTEMLLKRIAELEEPREREFRRMAATRLGMREADAVPESPCETISTKPNNPFNSREACQAKGALRNIAEHF